MRLTQPHSSRTDLSASQAAQLLRSGRLGETLIARANAQVTRHRSATNDQADALRRAIRALETAPGDGAAA